MSGKKEIWGAYAMKGSWAAYAMKRVYGLQSVCPQLSVIAYATNFPTFRRCDKIVDKMTTKLVMGHVLREKNSQS